MSIQQKLKIPNLFSMYDFVSVILETFSCHPSSVTHNCTNIVIWYNVKTMSFQCLTLEWLCCIAQVKRTGSY
ncbi:hypothetical protein [Wolbachia endosymbiont of Glossina morsitans morsitans]|uniref:hypothetical protein n=1 Tax=Wolbachia endosymbiont of Glossina morsitans morsitans TaxID=1150948 RepID=UPI001F1201B0|nr:hypothetical protein [Wolbachia endosymbiont of Glossina morsitans morsitans]